MRKTCLLRHRLKHGIDPLFYGPLRCLKLEYLDHTVSLDPGAADRIFYSGSELARQVRARILIQRLPIRT